MRRSQATPLVKVYVSVPPGLYLKHPNYMPHAGELHDIVFQGSGHLDRPKYKLKTPGRDARAPYWDNSLEDIGLVAKQA